MNECCNRWKTLVRLICLLGVLVTAAPVSAYAPAVTMSVVDANLGVVLAEVARIGKANIVINVKPNETITVSFDSVPFETALYFIARTKGLSIDKKNANTYIVTSAEDMEKGFREVKVFSLKYARADHIKNVIVGGGKSDSEFAVENPGASGSSDAGTLKVPAGGATASGANQAGMKGLVINTDASTNSIIAFGTPAQLEKVNLLLTELDVPYQQVLLEAQMVSLSKNASQSLGIDWNWGALASNASSSTSYFPMFMATGGDGKAYSMGINTALNALITSGDGKLLARPNVLTFNGNKATIFVGDQLPIVTPNSSTSGGTITYTTSYKNAGITLSYVPRINADRQIAASVFVEVSTPVSVTLDVGGQKSTAYQITTRSAQTNVRMKDGDTLVIGGLISSSDVKSFNKIPVLGDLPVLGKLFQSISKAKNETEVVVFLKAKIVK
ncbi:MAG TPA: secretin N-terminal domain-containing protein [Negativicutes bacterium]|nr:secretin N-terminal domain-containing protein [Negativicutes bacterium]